MSNKIDGTSLVPSSFVGWTITLARPTGIPSHSRHTVLLKFKERHLLLYIQSTEFERLQTYINERNLFLVLFKLFSTNVLN